MRRLDFTGPEAKERFDILYSGLVETPRGLEAPTETRVIGKILDKLEAVGQSYQATKEGPVTYVLSSGGGIVDLEDAEFALMAECLKAVKWLSRGARKATDAVDWFLQAKEPPKPVDEA